MPIKEGFSSKLLNYTESYLINNELKTKFFSEHDTNYSVGDTVYIINGNYDSDKIAKENNTASGYKILAIDKTGVVLDINFQADVPPYNQEALTEFTKVYLADSDERYSYENVDNNYLYKKLEGDKYSTGNNYILLNKLKDAPLIQDVVQYNNFYKTTKTNDILVITNSYGYLYNTTATASDSIYDQPIGETYNITGTFSYITPFYSNLGQLISIDYDVYTADDSAELSSFIGLSSTKLWRNVLYDTTAAGSGFPFTKMRVSNEVASLQGNFNRLTYSAASISVVENYMVDRGQTYSYIVNKLPSGVYPNSNQVETSSLNATFYKTDLSYLHSSTMSSFVSVTGDDFDTYLSNIAICFGNESRYADTLDIVFKSDMVKISPPSQFDAVLKMNVYGVKWLSENGYTSGTTFIPNNNLLKNAQLLFSGNKTVVSDNTSKTISISLDSTKLDFYNAYVIDYRVQYNGVDLTYYDYGNDLSGFLYIKNVKLASKVVETVSTKTVPSIKTIAPTILKETKLYNAANSYCTIATDSDGAFIYGDSNSYIFQFTFTPNGGSLLSRANIGSGSSNIEYSNVFATPTPNFRMIRGDRFPTSSITPISATATSGLLSAKITYVEDNTQNKLEPSNNINETSNQIVYSTTNGLYFFINDKENSDSNSLLGIHLNYTKLNPLFSFVTTAFNNVHSVVYIGRVKAPSGYTVPADANYISYFDMSNTSFLSKRWFKYLVHSDLGLNYVYINAEYAKYTTSTFKFSDDNLYWVEKITPSGLTPSGLSQSNITTVKYVSGIDMIVFGFNSSSSSPLATLATDTLPFTNDPTTVGFSVTGIEYSSKHNRVVVSYLGKGLRVYTPYETVFDTIDATTVVLGGIGLPTNNITQLTIQSDVYYDYIAVNTANAAWKIRFDLVSLLPFYTKVDFDNNIIPLDSDIERNSKILIMEDFEYNGTEFKKDKIYKYVTNKKSWVLDIEYNVPIITKSNFRKGVFNQGTWNDGLLGHFDKTAEWNDTLSQVNFRNGIVYNTLWINGSVMSKSKDFKTYNYAYLKDNKLNTYSDTLNNGGFGYNNFIESNIQNITLENGVIENSSIGATSSNNTLMKYVTGTTSIFSATVSITKSKISNSDINSINISNSKIFNSNILNSNISNSILIDSGVNKSVILNTTVDNNGAIKVIDYDKWFNVKDLPNGKIEVSIIHKFFVTNDDLLKLNYGDKINFNNVESNYNGAINVFNSKNFFLKKGYLTNGEFSDVIEDLHQNNLFPVKILVSKKTDRQNKNKTYLVGGGANILDVAFIKNLDKKYASIDINFIYGEFDNTIVKSTFDDDGLKYTSVKSVANTYIHINGFTNNIVNNSLLRSAIYVGERSHKINYINADNRLDARLITATYSTYNYQLSIKLDVHNDIITLNNNDVVYLDNVLYTSSTISNYDISGYYLITNYSTVSTTATAKALTPNFTSSIVATSSATISSLTPNNYIYSDSIYNTEINKGLFTRLHMENITFATSNTLSATASLLSTQVIERDNIVVSEQNFVNKLVTNKNSKTTYYKSIFDSATISGGRYVRAIINNTSLLNSTIEESYVDSSRILNSTYKKSNVDIRLPYTGTVSVGALWIDSTANNSIVSDAIWLSGTFSGGLVYSTKWISGAFIDGRFGKSDIEAKNTIFYSGVFGDNTSSKTPIVDNGIVGYDSDIYGVVNIEKYKKYSKNSNTIAINAVTWNKGTFNNGVFTGTKFQNSTFSTVTDDISLIVGSYSNINNTWNNGTFNGGSIVLNTIWLDGTFNGGKFKSIYGNGYTSYSWNDGTFNGGIFGNGTSSFTTWNNGTFNGGSFIGTIWNNGVFTRGEFTGSGLATASTTIPNSSVPVTIYGAFDPNQFIAPYNAMSNYYGLWRDGRVTSNILDSNIASQGFLKSAAIAKLRQVIFNKKIDNSINFKNMLWVRGSFDSNSGKIDNSIWLSGQFLNGEMINSSFNPYVTRKNYATTSTATASSYDLSSYTYWNNGKMTKSNFYASEWNNGTFEGGVNDFTNKIDQTNGNMIGGLFKKGTSNYMNAYNTIWKSGRWRNGNWYGANFALFYERKDIQAFYYLGYPSFTLTNLGDSSPKFLRDIIANNFARFDDINGSVLTNYVTGGINGTFDAPDTVYPTAISGMTLNNATPYTVPYNISNTKLFVDIATISNNIGSSFNMVFTVANLLPSKKYRISADISCNATAANIDTLTMELINYSDITLIGSVSTVFPNYYSTNSMVAYYQTGADVTGSIRFTYNANTDGVGATGFFMDNIKIEEFTDGMAFAWNCFTTTSTPATYPYSGTWSSSVVGTSPFLNSFSNTYGIGSTGSATVATNTINYSKTSYAYQFEGGVMGAKYNYNILTTNQIIFTPASTPLLMSDDNNIYSFVVTSFLIPPLTTVRFYSETDNGVYTLMKNGSSDAIITNTNTIFSIATGAFSFVLQKGTSWTKTNNPHIKIEIDNRLMYNGGTASLYTTLPITSKSAAMSFTYSITQTVNDTVYKQATNSLFSEAISYTIDRTDNSDYSLSYFNDTNKKLSITAMDATITDVNQATFVLGSRTSTVKTMIGTGAFLEGIWENGAWNSGARTYTPYNTENKTLVTDRILSVYKKNVNTWNIIIGIPVVTPQDGILDIIAFMKNNNADTTDINKIVSVGNLAAIDINGNRKVIKDVMTATLGLNASLNSNYTSLQGLKYGDVNPQGIRLYEQIVNGINYYTLVLEYKETFPIVNIVKDSENHAIYVSKNIWLNGLFLNGVFEGVWNGGLFKGGPYITQMKDSQWIDGTFDGGKFTSTKKAVTNSAYSSVTEIGLVGATNSVFNNNSNYPNATLNTGLIQEMEFNSSLVLDSLGNIPYDTLINNKIYSYLSFLDVVFDEYTLSSIFDQSIINDRLNQYDPLLPNPKKYKNVPTGQITNDVLSSNSTFIYENPSVITNVAFKNKTSYNIYNLKLGTKYKTYTTLFEVDFSKSPNNSPLLDVPNTNVKYAMASYSIALYGATATNSSNLSVTPIYKNPTISSAYYETDDVPGSSGNSTYSLIGGFSSYITRNRYSMIEVKVEKNPLTFTASSSVNYGLLSSSLIQISNGYNVMDNLGTQSLVYQNFLPYINNSNLDEPILQSFQYGNIGGFRNMLWIQNKNVKNLRYYTMRIFEVDQIPLFNYWNYSDTIGVSWSHNLGGQTSSRTIYQKTIEPYTSIVPVINYSDSTFSLIDSTYFTSGGVRAVVVSPPKNVGTSDNTSMLFLKQG